MPRRVKFDLPIRSYGQMRARHRAIRDKGGVSTKLPKRLGLASRR